MANPLDLVRMAGSSIAGPSAAAWITDFLNAAFYARPRQARAVDDLRLAHAILATRWAQSGRRLGARDLPAFHRAFGARRMHALGKLDRAALREGGAALLGDWFPAAWDDPERRAHGMAFPTRAARWAFDPAHRRRHAPLRRMTPPRGPADRQNWKTYDPVELPDPEGALRLIRDPSRWPDMSSAGGRFTALRSGGLADQTFEIDLVLQVLPRALVITRCYVTCTMAHFGGRGLGDAVDATAEHVEVLPDGAEPLGYVELTTHDGHPLGRAISRLIVFSSGEVAFIRDVGSWDPLPPHLTAAYAAGGYAAQVAFWGPDDEEASMLAQLAIVTGG